MRTRFILQKKEKIIIMLSAKNVKVFQSIDDIGKSAVDSIADDPFFTYGWFKTLENQTNKVSPIYIAIYEDNRIVCIAPFFIESIEQDALGLFSKLLNLFFPQNKALTCYSPRCYRSKVLFSNNQKEKTILYLLNKKIDEICKKQKIIKSHFPYISEYDKLLLENLEKYGYQKMLGVTTLYLKIKWSTFDEYIESLKYKTRKKIKREIRKFKENGILIEEVELQDLATKLSDLYENLNYKYHKDNYKGRVFDTQFFNSLYKYAKENTKIFIAKKDNEIIGFSLLLKKGDTLDVPMVGFNYDAQTKTDFSYFNLAYYTPIQWAIENKIEKIYYRYTMEKIKLDRGCTPEKTYYFVKYHNNFIRIIHDNTVNNPIFNYLRRNLGSLSF